MIIFDLDGTLANCEHRRYFVDRQADHPDYFRKPCKSCNDGSHHKIDPQIHKITGKLWKPDWDAFEEACDKDQAFYKMTELCWQLSHFYEIQIWSGRSEKVREKTKLWLYQHSLARETGSEMASLPLKMRPIGNTDPDDQLKEKWLDEVLAQGKYIDMVFDDRQKVVDMWRRRGITCLQVAEGDF